MGVSDNLLKSRSIGWNRPNEESEKLVMQIVTNEEQPCKGQRKSGTLPAADAVGSARKLEIVAVNRLKPYPGNARTHSCKQIRQVADSIQRFGFNNPVLIDDDGAIIAGHGRVAAAKLLGWSDVPTLRISHLSPAEKRAYVIADNRLAEKAGWDHDTLAIELQALVDLEFDVELTGFEADEIALIVDHYGKGKAKSKSRAAKQETQHASGVAVSRCGDVWLLGNHRLVCGDGDTADADAVLRQWEAFTGKPALLTATGQTLRAVTAQREPSTAVPHASLSHATAMGEAQ